jgi:DNA-binding FrmR family transcriptional regulator
MWRTRREETRHWTAHGVVGYTIIMSHTIRNKAKLAKRVARIVGQLQAVARAVDDETECGEVLRLIASARGAMNGLMAEVLEDHIRHHTFEHSRPGTDGADAADEVVDVIRSYLK